MTCVSVALCMHLPVFLDGNIGATRVEGDPTNMDTIVATWRERAMSFPEVRLTITPDAGAGIDRFSLFQGHWVPDDSAVVKPPGAAFLLKGEKLRFESVRWAMGEHGKPVHAHGRTMQSRRLGRYDPSAFRPALYSFFRDSEAEYENPQPFIRLTDGQTLVDHWLPVGSAYPRVTIHRAATYGSRAWVLLIQDRETSHQLDSLSLVAGVLAVHPLHKRIVNLRPENCKLRTERQIINGSRCLIIDETPTTLRTARRTFWIDPSRECVIRRCLGQYGDERVQIDLAYTEDRAGSVVPALWTVMRFRDSDDPVRAFVRSAVAVETMGGEPPEQLFDPPPVQPGSWVIDEVNREQYLVGHDGSHRVVTNDDLQWSPTYQELLRTNPGEVRGLIESTARWQRVREFARPLIIGVLLVIFVMAAWAGIRRRSSPSIISQANL